MALLQVKMHVQASVRGDGTVREVTRYQNAWHSLYPLRLYPGLENRLYFRYLCPKGLENSLSFRLIGDLMLWTGKWICLGFCEIQQVVRAC